MKKNNFWKEKNIFITGCTGLAGSWLTKFLIDEGANVVGLVRDVVPRSILFSSSREFSYINDKLTVVNGCIEDYYVLERTLNEYEIEIVFHLAAQTIVGMANRNPLSTFESNIRGTYNLLEACRRNEKLIKAIVVASSDKAYGQQKELPYNEGNFLQGTHPYDVSKSCVDLIAQCYHKTYKLPVCITRCGNFYGPGDLNFNRIIPQTIRYVLNNERPVIRSDGGYVRDYFYIKDAANAYKFLVEKMYELNINGEAFNFSAEEPLTVIEITNKILKLMKKKNIKPIIRNQAINEIRKQYLSAKKARNILGWKPMYNMEESLKETIVWYKNFFNA